MPNLIFPTKDDCRCHTKDTLQRENGIQRGSEDPSGLMGARLQLLITSSSKNFRCDV